MNGALLYKNRIMGNRSKFLQREKLLCGIIEVDLETVQTWSFIFHDHVTFIKDVAAARPPEHLGSLLKLLQLKGETIVSPGSKQGVIPLAIPLSRNSSGALTALLRWPTSPSGMEMPVIEVRKHGVWLLAKHVDHYIHRILVEEDVKNTLESNDEVFDLSAEVGSTTYKKGDFVQSRISNLDDYLLRKVGLFPDVLERKVMYYFDKGDSVSALVTGEFYTKKEHFPGFGRPFVFNAEILLKIGRRQEAKDAARGALKSPWWTLGCPYHEVATIADCGEEPIGHVTGKVSEAGKEGDLNRGKAPDQIAVDEAAFLLDLASVEGNWDDFVERIAKCYEEAGLHRMSRFILHRE